MADLSPTIETLENQLMRGWTARDPKAMKSLLTRDFRMVFATQPLTVLDAPSWLDGVKDRLRCSAFRFGPQVFARRSGTSALFAARLDLDLRLDGDDWSGDYFVADLWRKSKMRRRWQLAERILSRPEGTTIPPEAIRSLQLWR